MSLVNMDTFLMLRYKRLEFGEIEVAIRDQ